MLSRTATCHCGNLNLSCKGEPSLVAMCHCEACQRRTGSAFSLGAWFEQENVSIEGKASVFARTGDEGLRLDYHFCPDCGSNVYWMAASSMGERIGVAAGTFADPSFPQPTLSCYDKRRHPWVTGPENIPCHMAGVGSKD
jgi:hypothetical protein